MAIIAFFIFALTLTLVIWQPKGLGIGWTAIGGAALALLAGVVDWNDVGVVAGIVWNATLSLVAIVLISLILDEIGFFEWAALHMARRARGDGRIMFVLIVLLGAVVSAFFTNDGGVLIMTPIVLAMVRALNMDEKAVIAFVMASGFIADTSSLPFVISNLVNIISADFFGIGFARYAAHMVIPNLFSIAASLLMLYLVYRKSIPAGYALDQLRNPEDAIKDRRLFRLSWYILAALLVFYFAGELLHLPVSLLVGTAAIVFLLLARRSPVINTRHMIKSAPWKVVVFSLGMYVVVYGLRNAGLTDMLGTLIKAMTEQGLYVATVGMGFLSAILSSVMNNLPTVMIGALAIDGTAVEGAIREAVAFANVVGSDLGPKMTPIGSLATLLWLHVLSGKNVRISWGYYFKTGVILTLPVLFVTLSAMAMWLSLL